MRILVDLPAAEVRRLDDLSRRQNTSRAELIRHAVAAFLAQNSTGLADSFGLWKDRGVAGLEYQQTLRGEWEG